MKRISIVLVAVAALVLGCVAPPTVDFSADLARVGMSDRDPDAAFDPLGVLTTAREVGPVDRSFVSMDANSRGVVDEPNLMVVDLPRSSGSINVGWWSNGAERVYDPNLWLRQGYDGVRFQGEGRDVTHVRCTSWDGVTLAVRQHSGVVELRDLTLHAGYSQATAFGEQNLAKTIAPEFELRLVNVRVVADEPSAYAGKRPKWLVFGYQFDLTMIDCELDGREAVEHDVYVHGSARDGTYVEGCDFVSAGAECIKTRSDASETAWAGPQVKIVVRSSTFRNWYQPWSWRGGAGMVVQGGASNVLVEDCVFYGGEFASGGGVFPDVPAHQRSRAVMITAEANSYDVDTGAVGTGYGNGWVVVRRSGFFAGGRGPEWYGTIARVGRNSGSQRAAKGFLFEQGAILGDRMAVQVDNVPRWAIRRANTPAILNYCRAHFPGVDVVEASVFGPRGLVKASAGAEFGTAAAVAP